VQSRGIVLLVGVSSLAMAGCFLGGSCNANCRLSELFVNVAPDRQGDVAGLTLEGACNPAEGAVCAQDAATGCAYWHVRTTGAGFCTVRVHFMDAPDVVFTTSVSHADDGCCRGFFPDLWRPFQVPSLPDAGGSS